MPAHLHLDVPLRVLPLCLLLGRGLGLHRLESLGGDWAGLLLLGLLLLLLPLLLPQLGLHLGPEVVDHLLLVLLVHVEQRGGRVVPGPGTPQTLIVIEICAGAAAIVHSLEIPMAQRLHCFKYIIQFIPGPS